MGQGRSPTPNNRRKRTQTHSIPHGGELFRRQHFQLPLTLTTNELVRIVVVVQFADSALFITHSFTSLHLQNVCSFRHESTKATDEPLNQVVHSPLLHVIHSFILLPPIFLHTKSMSLHRKGTNSLCMSLKVNR